MNNSERTLEFWIWYFIYYLLINSIWIENVILNSIWHEYLLPKHNNNNSNNIFCLCHFAICNCINDALIISSWYLIDRTLLSWSSKIRKCYKVQGFLPFSLDEHIERRIRMRFVSFILCWWNSIFICFSLLILDVQAIILAYYFLFIRVEIHCWIWVYLSVCCTAVCDFICVHKANYLCHLWFAITVVFWIFAQTFHWPKIRLIFSITRMVVIHKRNTHENTFYHQRLDETKHKIISLSQPHRCFFFSLPLNVLCTFGETLEVHYEKKNCVWCVHVCVCSGATVSVTVIDVISNVKRYQCNVICNA